MTRTGKVAVLVSLTFIFWCAQQYYATYYAHPELAELAVRQFESNAEHARDLQWLTFAGNYATLSVFVVLALFLFGTDLARVLRQGVPRFGKPSTNVLLAGVLALPLFCAGCVYDTPEFVEVDTSESAFAIPLEGNVEDQTAFSSAELLEERKVAAKRVQVPHRWVQQGYLPCYGEYIDTIRVIKVNRRPVTRIWTADLSTGTSSRDEAIWVESKDSVSFSIGFTCTANIPESQASTFLYRYTAKSLADVMDTEIRGKIQESASDVCALYDLDELRAKKPEIIEKVRQNLRPFFSERGIEITTVAITGGFVYENPQIQASIDKTVQDQQLKVSALAERDAQKLRNETLRLAAEAEGEAEKIRAAAKAEGIKCVANAKAYEIEQALANKELFLDLKRVDVEMELLKKWDGSYPTYLMTTGERSPQLMLQVPTAQNGR